MNLREIITMVQTENGSKHPVVGLHDLSLYVGEMFRAKLDDGYIANKIRNEINELKLELFEVTLKKTKEAVKQQPTKAPVKKIATAPKPRPAPKQDELEPSEEEYEDAEEFDNQGSDFDEDVTGEAEKIKRLKEAENELFGD